MKVYVIKDCEDMGIRVFDTEQKPLDERYPTLGVITVHADIGLAIIPGWDRDIVFHRGEWFLDKDAAVNAASKVLRTKVEAHQAEAKRLGSIIANLGY